MILFLPISGRTAPATPEPKQSGFVIGKFKKKIIALNHQIESSLSIRKINEEEQIKSFIKISGTFIKSTLVNTN